MDECIFCKIVKGEIPAKIAYESESVIAFPDIHPSADLHLLIVPKEHIGSLKDLSVEHSGLLAEMYTAINKLVEDNDLKDSSYRVVVNGGKAQTVPHLHFHLLGGKWFKFV